MGRESLSRYSEGELLDWSKRTGRSTRTLYRWIKEGCVLEDPESLGKFINEKELKKPPVQKKREAAGIAPNLHQSSANLPAQSNGEVLAPIGRRGAAAALERLENQEERAHARLQAALTRGNPVEIDAAQTFWLKCSETLRRLDLAVEVARRQEETQIPLKVAQAAVLACAEWLRIAVAQFLSSEGTTVAAGFASAAEFKIYFLARFKGVLDLVVKGADKTNSAIPSWAVERIKTAWSIED